MALVKKKILVFSRGIAFNMSDRNYIAISLKHSTKDCIMYWGTRTQDNESRCFSGYTANFSNCELYSPDEFYRKRA